MTISAFAAATGAAATGAPDVARSTFMRTLGALLPAKRAVAPRAVAFLFETIAHAAGAEQHAAAVARTALTAALSTMCGGKSSDTVDAVFVAFDSDGNGTLEFDEVRRYLRIVFLVTLRYELFFCLLFLLFCNIFFCLLTYLFPRLAQPR